ncbi:unnamed protein product [Phytophthora fragariaefolia]|uniref:Unnamed protein product n=1 Tax=Phytophthora fragariaefolia TaxID=1490495 RepID=A0A9W6XDU4_9STRA|nr:unnamed protein product [Phytophthora fragariaefolia]
MVSRCLLWKFRARTIRGRAVKNLCKSFLFKKSISSETVTTGDFAEQWMHWPVFKGGLGLPETKAFCSAMRLCILNDAVRSANLNLYQPKWFEPAAQPLALDGSGVEFDILYAVVPKAFPAPERWKQLGDFWYTTFHAWGMLRETYLDVRFLCENFKNSELKYLREAPLWNNFLFKVGTLKRTMEKSSQSTEHYRLKGYIRIQDMTSNYEGPVTLEMCQEILQDIDFDRQRLRSLAASVFFKHLRNWDLDKVVRNVGVPRPSNVASAAHAWTFRNMEFTSMKNKDLYRQLHDFPTIQSWPHQALDIEEKLWRTDLTLDKHILPILSDLRFRMQHNGLNVRRKYGYTNKDITCPHGCELKETVKHLFWDCEVAKTVWPLFTDPIRFLLEVPVSWESVAYMKLLHFTNSSLEEYGFINLAIVFNIVRSVVLYPLWIHRNHRIFQNVQTSPEYVGCRAKAYARLHQESAYVKTTNLKLIRLIRQIGPAFDISLPSDTLAEMPPSP